MRTFVGINLNRKLGSDENRSGEARIEGVDVFGIVPHILENKVNYLDCTLSTMITELQPCS